jgi:hypothetical protein
LPPCPGSYLDPYVSPISAVLTSGMSEGLQSQSCSEGGQNLAYISNNTHTVVTGVNFGYQQAPTTLCVPHTAFRH